MLKIYELSFLQAVETLQSILKYHVVSGTFMASDVVNAIEGCCYKPAVADEKFNFLNPDCSKSFAPHMVFNVGSNNPISLIDFIEKLEDKLGAKARKNYLPIQPGDVEQTWANIDRLNSWIGYKPLVSFDDGIANFARWYKSYF